MTDGPEWQNLLCFDQRSPQPTALGWNVLLQGPAGRLPQQVATAVWS